MPHKKPLNLHSLCQDYPKSPHPAKQTQNSDYLVNPYVIRWGFSFENHSLPQSLILASQREYLVKLLSLASLLFPLIHFEGGIQLPPIHPLRGIQENQGSHEHLINALILMKRKTSPLKPI
jgi:hypothetical protein